MVDPASAPCLVATVAARLPASSGERRQVADGTKGPIESEWARQRVTRCTEGLPERTVWRVSKRTVGAEPTDAYSISTAPARTPWHPFVW
jgi:hypothetical protein